MNKRELHILLIAGTGQNVGKTLLACKLIRQFSIKMDVVGIKISPHFHKLSDKDKVIQNHENYVIVEEICTDTGKDSSRMLKAGANRVLYLQVHDEHLEEAMTEIKKILPPCTPIICESGGLGKFITPGVFLMVHRKSHPEIKLKAQHFISMADVCLEFDGDAFDQKLESLSYTSQGWTLKETAKTHTI